MCLEKKTSDAFMTYKEILELVLECANGDVDLARDAFYPEFYSSLMPGTTAFNHMVERKIELQKYYRSVADPGEEERLVKEAMVDDPIYGWRINVAGSRDGFDWDKFIEVMTK